MHYQGNWFMHTTINETREHKILNQNMQDTHNTILYIELEVDGREASNLFILAVS